MRLNSISPVIVAALILPLIRLSDPSTTGGVGTIGAAPAYTESGTKTFNVDPHTVFANYDVWTRECTTGDISSCSASWVLRLHTFDGGGTPMQLQVYVNVDNAEDCETYGPTWQIKFTSSGFGSPQNTVYHTADTCNPLFE